MHRIDFFPRYDYCNKCFDCSPWCEYWNHCFDCSPMCDSWNCHFDCFGEFEENLVSLNHILWKMRTPLLVFLKNELLLLTFICLHTTNFIAHLNVNNEITALIVRLDVNTGITASMVHLDVNTESTALTGHQDVNTLPPYLPIRRCIWQHLFV